MSNQADNKNVIINKTLQVLVKHNHLTPAEVAQLRLPHLHLAGKNPTISFTPAGQQEPKIVTLDMETHRALVGWLVNRPDSTGDFLFPGEGDEAMSLETIQGLLQQAESVTPPPPAGPDLPKPAVPPEADLPAPAEPPLSASRPVRPLSRPEMGTPPPGAAPIGAAFVPPPGGPEEEEPVNIPLPSAAPVPPPTRPPASQPVSPPRPPAEPISRPEPPPSSPATPPSPVKTEEAAAVPDLDATLAGAKIKEETPVAPPPPVEKTAEQTIAAPAKKEAKSAPVPPLKKVEPPLAAKDKPSMSRPLQERSRWSRPLIPGIVVIVLLCAVCLAGSWYAAQSETGSQFLASLGWSGQPTDEAEATAEATRESVVFESALPTPTLPPTATSTPLPPTNTPPPTDTATPTPFPDTPTPVGTDTPTPTDTPEPTDTPSPEETEEAVATEEAPTPTPGLKYPAPEIIDPKDGFAFIRGNTIVLRWKPVELAPNEQYAVRLVYTYQGQPTYQGANIKESEWTVPLSLFGQIDGPDNRYEWFVVIERLNDDGSGTAVSPESEHRTFTWK